MYPSKMIGYNRQLTSHFDTSTLHLPQLDGYVQIMPLYFAHSHLTRNWEPFLNAHPATIQQICLDHLFC
jgi:hypothetical protein